MDGIYTMASSSVSSLYGNVNAAVREYLLSRFPRDFFKYVGLSTEAAFHNVRRTLGGNNSKKKIQKRQKPYITIQPMYQVSDRDMFLQDIPLSKNIDDLQYRTDGRYLLDIAADEQYGYKLKYKVNRDRIEFDVRIVVSTLHQQIDLYKAMQNQIVWERAFTRKTALESVIPKSIIYYIGKMCKMDVEKDDYMIPMLLQRMNATSQYPITYKLRNASATDEYYMYYMHNIVLCFYDLSIEEGSKIGMVDDHFDITFKVSAEFNLPGLYVITGNIQKMDRYKVVLSATNSAGIAGDPSNSDYIPLFTIDNIYSKYPPEKDGMRLLGSSRFLCDGTSKEEEILNVAQIFSLDQRKVIQFHTTYNMQPETLVRMIVIKNNTELIEGTDFDMDWNTFDLTIKNPDKDATYRIVIYINLIMMNDVLLDIQESKSHEKPGLMKNNIHQEDQFPVVETPAPLLPDESSSEPTPDNPGDNDDVAPVEPEVTTRQISEAVRVWCEILNITDIYNAAKNLEFEKSEGVD